MKPKLERLNRDSYTRSRKPPSSSSIARTSSHSLTPAVIYPQNGYNLFIKDFATPDILQMWHPHGNICRFHAVVFFISPSLWFTVMTLVGSQLLLYRTTRMTV